MQECTSLLTLPAAIIHHPTLELRVPLHLVNVISLRPKATTLLEWLEHAYHWSDLNAWPVTVDLVAFASYLEELGVQHPKELCDLMPSQIIHFVKFGTWQKLLKFNGLSRDASDPRESWVQNWQ